MEDQDTSLLLPNQLQANVITDNNVPSRLHGGDVENPHSIYVPEEYVTIQLKVKGVMSGFDTRIPTQSELDMCRHIVLTNNSKWDPISSELDHNEETYENNNCNDLGPKRPKGGRQLFATHLHTEVSAVFRDVSNTLQDDCFLKN